MDGNVADYGADPGGYKYEAEYGPSRKFQEERVRAEGMKKMDAPKTKTTRRKCPQNAALIIAGNHYFCDMMDQMHESCDTHDGWPHASRAAEAIWQ
jgi:hypothetical protein